MENPHQTSSAEQRIFYFVNGYQIDKNAVTFFF